MGDIETDKDDRPLDPPRLISVEVLLNPFDDIVPRNLSGGGAAAAAEAQAAAAAEATKKRRKKQGKKDFKLLSFGEEADQEEKELDALAAGGGGGPAGGRGVKSAHDALDDDRFSKDAAYDAEAVRRVEVAENAEDGLRKAVKSAAANGTGEASRCGRKQSFSSLILCDFFLHRVRACLLFPSRCRIHDAELVLARRV